MSDTEEDRRIESRLAALEAGARQMERHYDDCGRRYGEIGQALRDVRREVADGFERLSDKISFVSDRVFEVQTEADEAEKSVVKAQTKLVYSIGASFITLLLIIIAYLLVHGTPWTGHAISEIFNALA